MGIIIREKKTKNGISLYLDISHNGHRRYEFMKIYLTGKRKDRDLDNEKRELARQIKNQRDYELIIKENDLPDRKKRNADFTKYFNDWVYATQKGQRFYDGAYKRFIRYTKSEPLRFADITADWFLGYQEYLLQELSVNGTIQYMSAISTALNKAVKDEIIRKNPYPDIPEELKLRKSKTHIEFLTEEEVYLLMRTETRINPQIRDAFIFCCFTGLRISDVSKLKWSEIQTMKIDNRKVQIMSFQQQKTSSNEYLPLSKEAEKIISRRKFDMEQQEFTSPIDSMYVFPAIFDKQGNRSRHGLVNKKLKALAKDAGLTKNLHFHMSRHTFATMLLSNGVDIVTVSKLMGHSNVDTTLSYLHVINQNKINAVDKLPTIYEPMLRKVS